MCIYIKFLSFSTLFFNKSQLLPMYFISEKYKYFPYKFLNYFFGSLFRNGLKISLFYLLHKVFHNLIIFFSDTKFDSILKQF